MGFGQQAKHIFCGEEAVVGVSLVKEVVALAHGWFKRDSVWMSAANDRFCPVLPVMPCRYLGRQIRPNERELYSIVSNDRFEIIDRRL